MENEYITCPTCEGNGYVVVEDYEAACCFETTSTGECCGNAVPLPYQRQEMCPQCNGDCKILKND